MSNEKDQNFYLYTQEGFIPSVSPLNYDFDDDVDVKVFMERNGWVQRTHYGSEYVFEIFVYSPSGRDTGDRFVELIDHSQGLWSAVVPASLWPRFIRDEILPFIKCVSLSETSEEMKRVGNAIISIGRHGIGLRDLDEITGTSNRDERARADIRRARIAEAARNENLQA
jgi:hypothetical protein